MGDIDSSLRTSCSEDSLSSEDELPSSQRCVSERTRFLLRFFRRVDEEVVVLEGDSTASEFSGTSMVIGEVQRCAGTPAW